MRRKMKCELVIKAVQSALDVDGPSRLTQAAEQHLAECASCRAAVADLTQIHNALVEREADAGDVLPGGFHARLISRISEEPIHARPAAAGTSIWWLAGVAAMVIVFAGWYFVMETSGGRNLQVVSNKLTAQPTPGPTPAIDATRREVADVTNNVMAELRAIDVQQAIPTPALVYASVGAEVSDFGESFYAATTSLAGSLMPADTETVKRTE